MEKNGQALPPPDIRDYPENRRRFSLEELAPYAGMYVAFSLDGKCILASGTTEDILEQQLREKGIDPGQVVGSYIEAY
jgi:hypothetical protein